MNAKLFTMIYILFIPFSVPLLSMEQAIEKHNNKFNSFIAQATNKNLSIEFNKIVHKLDACENDLLVRKQNTLNAFKQHHGISDASWKQCMQLIQDVKQCNQLFDWQNYKTLPYDAIVPKSTVLLITKTLTENNIAPQSIHIQKLHDNSGLLYSVAESVPGIFYSSAKVNPTTRYRGTININFDIYSQLSYKSQITLCRLMVENIIQNSIVTINTIKNMEFRLSPTTTYFNHSQQFRDLIDMSYFILPQLLLSIHHEIFAQELISFYREIEKFKYTSFTNYLAIFHCLLKKDEHLNTLCKIDRYWKTLRWIREYKNKTIFH